MITRPTNSPARAPEAEAEAEADAEAAEADPDPVLAVVTLAESVFAPPLEPAPFLALDLLLLSLPPPPPPLPPLPPLSKVQRPLDTSYSKSSRRIILSVLPSL